MPVYIYKCAHCDEIIEVEKRITEADEKPNNQGASAECDHEWVKQIQRTGVVRTPKFGRKGHF